MKKVYISPETIQVKIAAEKLLVIVSGEQAASGEAGMGRQSNNNWEDE